MALVTIETRDDNEVCQHIAIYSQSNLCVCVQCVGWADSSSKDALHLCVGWRHSRTAWWPVCASVFLSRVNKYPAQHPVRSKPLETFQQKVQNRRTTVNILHLRLHVSTDTAEDLCLLQSYEPKQLNEYWRGEKNTHTHTFSYEMLLKLLKLQRKPVTLIF